MGSAIADSGWLDRVVKVISRDECGTGFLVARYLDREAGKCRIFLVTNKHVVYGKYSSYPKSIKCLFNSVDSSIIKSFTAEIELVETKKTIKEHPNKYVDVLAVDLTNCYGALLEEHSIIDKPLDHIMLADKKLREENCVMIGEEIFTIGYPLGFTQGYTKFPLVRQGIISTSIDNYIQSNIISRDDEQPIPLPAFFVDGVAVPGSSGSPVILNPSPNRYLKNGMTIFGKTPALLLGILSETVISPIGTGESTQKESFGFAGLAIAFNGESIIETIELFFED